MVCLRRVLLPAMAVVIVCLCAGLTVASSSANSGRKKRELPLNINCDIRPGSSTPCYKADLLDTSVADCKRSGALGLVSCDAEDGIVGSTSTNVADPSKYGVTCNPVSGKPVRCGEQDTRCVCDAPYDLTSPLSRPYFNNNCRCQYWPTTDIRESRASVCRQYDHGGTSGVHFYACCDNCQDPTDTSCDGDTYQGGGTKGGQCGNCGARTLSQSGSRLTYTFNCNSCQQQRYCNDYCTQQHPLDKVLPGLCPKWLGCFRGCCLQVNPSNRGKRATQATNITDFCGNRVCSPSESINTCPQDCCPTVNMDCTADADKCTQSCCLNSGCCLTTPTSAPDRSASPGLSPQLAVFVLAAIQGLVFLVSLVPTSVTAD